MKTSKLFVYLMLSLPLIICLECDEEDLCQESEAFEINFGVLLGGDLKITDINTKKDVTSNFSEFEMQITKVYCGNTFNGPFTNTFTIDDDGVLVKEGIGYWNFKMNNDLDHLKIEFFIKSKESDLNYFIPIYSPSYVLIYYEELKSQDGGKAYIHFTMKLNHVSSVSVESLSYTIN